MTNQPAVTYTDSTIKILLDDTVTSEIYEPAGRVSEKQYTGFVDSTVTINHMDRVTVQSILYEVRSTPTIEYLEGFASFKKFTLVRLTV